MEFDETPRFWCPRVALVVWINFVFCSNKILWSNYALSLSPCSPSVPSELPFLLLLLLLLLLFWILGSYGFIRVCFYSETIYFFSVHFILNELSASHFLTSEIFVKILSLKSLTTYYLENRKIFRLSQNLTKLF